MCSKFSSKCDLADYIAGTAGWYDKEGRPVKFGEGKGAYYCDDYRDFLAFKKATNGTLYQHKKVTVTEYNQDFVAQKCDNFKINSVVEKIKDKRNKDGYKEKTIYTYNYCDKEYKTLKELNKHGVWIRVEIHFDSMLELIPYYPYTVTASCKNEDGTQVVYISDKNYVDTERDRALNCGYDIGSFDSYKKALAKYTRDITLRYFNTAGRKVVEYVEFSKEAPHRAKLKHKIDTDFKVNWYFEGEPKTHWTSPKVIDAQNGIIEMSKEDHESYKLADIDGKASVEYVKAVDYPLYLG